MSSEPPILDALRESYRRLGPQRKVLRTQFGIAQGSTRKQAVPEWPEDFREVRDEYEHLLLEVHDNLHGVKPPDWWRQRLQRAAIFLQEKQNLRPGLIGPRLKQDFPGWYVDQYLPLRFKDPVKVKAGKTVKAAPAPEQKPAETEDPKGESLPNRQAEAASPALSENHLTVLRRILQHRDEHLPYTSLYRELPVTVLSLPAMRAIESGKPEEEIIRILRDGALPLISPRASEHRVAEYTPPHLRLLAAVNLRRMHPDSEKPFLRPGETTKEGKPKSYKVDLLFPGRLAVEVEGEGSSSKDNLERDRFLLSQGLPVLHLSNEEVNRDPDLAAWLIQKILELPPLPHDALSIPQLAHAYDQHLTQGPQVGGLFYRSLSPAGRFNVAAAVRNGLKAGSRCPCCGHLIPEVEAGQEAMSAVGRLR